MAAQFEFDIHEYSRIIRRRKWWAILAFIAVLGGVVFMTLRQPAEWQAVVSMRVNSESPIATIQGTAISYYGMRSGLDTETRLIEEDSSLHHSVLLLLQAEAEKDPSRALPAGFSERDIRSAIKAEQVQSSDLIRISVCAHEPQLAARIANAVATSYHQQYIATRTKDAEEKRNLIQTNLERVTKDLSTAQAHLRDMQQSQHAAGTISVYRTRLAEVEVQLGELTQKFTENHPAVINLLSEKKGLEERLRVLPDKEMEIERAKAACTQAGELQQEIQKQLFAAEVDYQAKKEEITQKISVLGDASATVQKLKPNETSNITVGALLGCVMGVVLCFVVEALDTSIGTIEDVERYTGLTVLGLIPYISRGTASKKASTTAQAESDPAAAVRQKIILSDTPNPVMSEAYRALRTNLQFVLPNKSGHHVILVSSAGPSEGKTINGLNLSIVLAQTGSRTLFVDADLRHPMVHRILGIPREPGLSDILIGKSTPREVVRTTEDLLLGSMDWDSVVGTQGLDNLNVATCGTYCPNPTDILAAAKTKDVIEDLRNQWDYVILDCAPIIPVADATLLGPMSDGVLIIYQVGKSSRHMLLRALKQIQVGESQLLGIVLNQIESDIQFRSYKYYRSSRRDA